MGKVARALEKSGFDHEPANNGTPVADGDSEGRRAQVYEPPGVTSSGWDERLTKATSFSPEVAESFRVLRSKILMPPSGRPAPRSIMVTSALPQEGKSFVTANLGIVMAQGVDQHSLLVDCDLRLPTLARLFGVSHSQGLVDFLRDGTPLPDLIKKISVDKLSLLPSGIPPINPAELLGSARMDELVAELSSRYPDRFVIYDSPPLNVASESMVLARVVDAVIVVVREGVANRPLLERVLADIGREKILGIIYNGQTTNLIRRRLIDKSHGYYGNYYHPAGS